MSEKDDLKKVIPKSLNKNMRFKMEREKAEEQNRHSSIEITNQNRKIVHNSITKKGTCIRSTASILFSKENNLPLFGHDLLSLALLRATYLASEDRHYILSIARSK